MDDDLDDASLPLRRSIPDRNRGIQAACTAVVVEDEHCLYWELVVGVPTRNWDSKKILRRK